MKKLLLLLLFASSAIAQVQPSTNKLFVRQSSARIATTNPADLSDPTKGVTTVSYQDASGRAMQTVSYRTSPDLSDQVQGTLELDALGRPKANYLPVKSPTMNAAFQGSYAPLAQSFYGDTAPFTEVDSYDPSPISSPIRSIAPGEIFQDGGKKGVTQNYETAGAGIRKYTMQASGNIDGTQSYNNGDLIKTTVVDEDGNTSVEYKGGKSGRLVLVQQKDRNSNTFLSTAYVYDFMGRLCYVVPPKAFNAQNNFTESGAYFDEGIYATHYDGRGRVAESHVPGGGWTYTIYNELDQVVMSQDARQRETNLWQWIKYDGHGRTVMGGTYVTANPVSQVDMQGYFNASTVTEQFEERTTNGGNVYGYTNRSFPSQVVLTAANVMTVDYYDNYFWVDNAALGFETYRSAQWTNVSGMATGSLVKNLGDGQMLKSIVYYDDRGRVIQTYSENRFGAINRTDATFNFAGDLLEGRAIYRKPGQADLTVEGIYTYDHVGRQTGAAQKVNGKVTPIAQYVYDGIGRLSQKNLMRSGKDFIVENTPQPNGDVDIANRSVILNPGTYTAENGTYLAAVTPDALQKIDYTYTVRGELRGINTDNNGNISLQDGDVFGMKLDHAETSQTFNGKLAGQAWQTAPSLGGGGLRAYTYNYDGYDRLQAAAFTGQGSENYSLGIVSYDANGNIDSLQRNGLVSNSSYGSIDNLGYTYLNKTFGNRLQGIEDHANNTVGHKDNGNIQDYTYYNDGSLKSDANKGITLIEYNYLGLPEKINFGSTRRIENVYDAEGMKLSQKLVDGGNVIQTDYMGGLIYRNGLVETIYHDEGRVKIDNGDLSQQHYQFFITDHLGNNRIIIERLNAVTALVQETHYYPFGAVMEGVGVSGDWNFLFQGKEFVDAFGYDAYDFGWRQGDSWLGRWMSQDPANQFMGITPYNYMVNNPLSYTDPDGRIVPLIIAGAAVIGGGINLWSNWGKVKGDWKVGLAYFASGAVGGAVGVGNPYLGGVLTSGINAGTDIATGNVPNVRNLGEGLAYVGGEVGKGVLFSWLGAQGGKLLSKINLGQWFTWSQTGYQQVNPGSIKIGDETINWVIEGGVKSSKVPLGRAVGNLAGRSVSGVADDVKSWTKVGRWMSETEYNTMKNAGKVLEGAGGQTFATTNGANGFTSAAKGSIYAEFEVPTNSLLNGGKQGWVKMIGPNAKPSQVFMLNKQGGDISPGFKNLSKILLKR